MAGPWYYDSSASGNNDGTSTANAWQTFQRAIDGTGGTKPVAGDIIYGRSTAGVETIDATTSANGADFTNANSGSAAAGHIRCVGCDASWTPNAAQCEIQGDGGDKPAHLLNCTTGADYWAFENFTFTGSNITGDIIYVATSAAEYWRYQQCIFQNGAARGTNTNLHRYTWFEQCQWINNTTIGAYLPGVEAYFDRCVIKGNGGTGIYASGGNVIEGCVIHDNAGDGIYGSTNLLWILNNVIDGNTSDGIALLAARVGHHIYGNTITNNGAYGIVHGTDLTGQDKSANVFEDWNIFYLNTSGHRSNINAGPNSLTAASAAEVGYADRANDDFNRTNASAILTSTAILLDW